VRGPLDPRTWLADRWLLVAVVLGILVRVLPLIVFPLGACLRDECIYVDMANDILKGKGLTVSAKGWLTSPGYPYMLAWFKELFGVFRAIKPAQVVLSTVCIGISYGIGLELGDKKVARISGFLFALNPTIAWFTNTMWIETMYIFTLLSSAIYAMSAWRNGSWKSGAASGVLLGAAVLFRGVATYLPPFWVLAVLYPDQDAFSWRAWVESARRRWRTAVALVVALVITVAPYSMYASSKYGGFMVTDATVGHVLYLGNNDYPPLTFDYGNGMLTSAVFGRYLKEGRNPCRRNVPPVQSARCEVKAAVKWISENPDTFVARVPMRVAQLLNPNSFLTRHLRWGYWPGYPWWAKEGTAVLIVLLSAALSLLGTAAVWAKARGPYAMMAVGTTLYTVATISVMYGMTRFRLPLEALWTPYLALFIADPRAIWDALRASEWRLAGVVLTLPAIFVLMLWYLPSGFPVFW
jgi:4-amino-4-deoxy-L-arabinose transferase-like glycosyltransferase